MKRRERERGNSTETERSERVRSEGVRDIARKVNLEKRENVFSIPSMVLNISNAKRGSTGRSRRAPNNVTRSTLLTNVVT